LGLMDADLEQMTPRLRRFVEKLFPYDLTWQYILGKENFIPDYLSWMAPAKPEPCDVHEALTFDAADTRFTKVLLGGGAFYERMATVSYEDETFAWLRRRVQHGWRRRCPTHIPELARVWPLRHRLRVSGPFILLDDDRVCVPASLRAPALELLHVGHPGATGMRAKARRVLYWPGWSRDMASTVERRVPCASQAAAPARPPFFWAVPPEFPGDHVAADHFSFGNECYLVILDVFSGFPFLYRCASPSTTSLLQATQAVFLQTGLPRVFLSDGGPAFTSDAFQAFLQACNVQHRCSSPQFPQSNGAAERAVRMLKTLRAKAGSSFDLFRCVLELQNTPRGPCQVSPADVFLGRSQRTWSNPCPRPSRCSWTAVHRSILTRQQRVDQASTPHWLRVRALAWHRGSLEKFLWPASPHYRRWHGHRALCLPG
jgi:transposase InsO family protein